MHIHCNVCGAKLEFPDGTDLVKCPLCHRTWNIKIYQEIPDEIIAKVNEENLEHQKDGIKARYFFKKYDELSQKAFDGDLKSKAEFGYALFNEEFCNENELAIDLMIEGADSAKNAKIYELLSDTFRYAYIDYEKDYKRAKEYMRLASEVDPTYEETYRKMSRFEIEGNTILNISTDEKYLHLNIPERIGRYTEFDTPNLEVIEFEIDDFYSAENYLEENCLKFIKNLKYVFIPKEMRVDGNLFPYTFEGICVYTDAKKPLFGLPKHWGDIKHSIVNERKTEVVNDIKFEVSREDFRNIMLFRYGKID